MDRGAWQPTVQGIVQANPPNAPCPTRASNPDRVSITSPSLSPAQPLLIQNSTETPTSGPPPLSAPSPAQFPWPGTRTLRHQPFPRSTGLYQPVTLARPCASQTLGLDCAPDSVSPVSRGRLSWLASHTPCTGPCPTFSVGLGPAAWWTRVRPKGPCHSLGGGKQAVPSPTTHGFLHQSSVPSPHSWHKACTPGDSLKERTDCPPHSFTEDSRSRAQSTQCFRKANETVNDLVEIAQNYGGDTAPYPHPGDMFATVLSG